MHCIGFSLGAHVCGQAGKKASKLNRVTGLDPAAPCFEHYPNNTKITINTGSADCVDILHADAVNATKENLYFGYLSPLGHVDYYANCARPQYNCTGSQSRRNQIPAWVEQLACSHLRALPYFILTINATVESPTSYPAADGPCDDDSAESCQQCSNESCLFQNICNGKAEQSFGYVSVCNKDDAMSCGPAGRDDCFGNWYLPVSEEGYGASVQIEKATTSVVTPVQTKATAASPRGDMESSTTTTGLVPQSRSDDNVGQESSPSGSGTIVVPFFGFCEGLLTSCFRMTRGTGH